MSSSVFPDDVVLQHPRFEGVWVYADSTLEPDYKGARCAEIGSDAWFYPNSDDYERKFEDSYIITERITLDDRHLNKFHSMLGRICQDCPALLECFNYAVHHEEWGFWGGTTRAQRKLLRRTHRIRLTEPFNSDEADRMIINNRELLRQIMEEGGDGDTGNQ